MITVEPNARLTFHIEGSQRRLRWLHRSCGRITGALYFLKALFVLVSRGKSQPVAHMSVATKDENSSLPLYSFPLFSLSCSFPHWHLHWRTWELNHLVKGSCQTRPQEQSLVGGMKCEQSGLHMNAHLEIVQIWALLVRLTTDLRPAPCVQSLSWAYEEVTELISDLFDTSVSSELQPPAVSGCFKRKWEERHLWAGLKVVYLWSCTTLR